MAISVNALDSVSYEDLYRRWERGNWRAGEIDFERDREQWESEFSDFDRKAALWSYSLFFWGEDAVAQGLSPYIDAAPLEEQKYFLATQQVDEARHAVFFKRFLHEVAGIGDGGLGGTLTAVEPDMTWGFLRLFERLDTMCTELRAKPNSVPTLAAAIALYHLVIEATVAQTGQHFISRYLSDKDLLPGFQEGMENVTVDEQRHIGFGVKILSDLSRMDPEVPEAVNDLLREVAPWTIAVIVPPGWDERYLENFGASFVDLGAEGLVSLESKLRSAGLPLDELPGPPAIPLTGDPREQASRARKLLLAGYLGEKTGPPSKDPEDVQLLFDSVAAGFDSSAASEPGAVQWEFDDADPFHVIVANGSTRAVPGVADAPRLRFRSAFEDWVDVVGGRKDPRVLMATGRLRPRGDLRWVWKSRRMFPLP